MAKSADAFRTISEVSDEIGVPQHVLRFWETKFSQVKPVKRGGGRRYYRPADIDLLRAINTLLYTDGYTIKGVQKLLREKGVKAVASGIEAVPADEVAAPTEAQPDPPAAAEPSAPAQPPAAAQVGPDAAMLRDLAAIRDRLSAALDGARI